MKNAYEIRGDVTAIFVNCKGTMLETLIDTSDLEKVKTFDGLWSGHWCKKTKQYYVYGRAKMVNHHQTRVQLHRFLFDNPAGLFIDHKNHVALDNRKSVNLRLANNSLNMQNLSGIPRHNTSGYRGVSFHKSTKKWNAYIHSDGKRIYLGIYEDKITAAKVAYQARRKFMPYYEERVEEWEI